MRIASGLGGPARTIGWLAITVALAFGGAGLVGQLSHPPGDSRREELTYTADVAMADRLDAISAQLKDLGSLVDGLSGDAKAALEAVAAGDGAGLQDDLDRGTGRATTAETAVSAIRATLAGLPGGGPDASAVYGHATLARRAALLAALDSVSGLGGLWTSVTARASDAAALTLAIRNHDAAVAAAAGLGVKAQYAAAIEQLDQAATLLAELAQLRARIVTTPDQTILDDWITRHDRYDKALLALYQALTASGGQRNPVVDAAYREENRARQDLPPDNRAIVVIVAEVAGSGLNQAVVAIEDASGRIDQALGTLSPT